MGTIFLVNLVCGYVVLQNLPSPHLHFINSFFSFSFSGKFGPRKIRETYNQISKALLAQTHQSFIKLELALEVSTVVSPFADQTTSRIHLETM